MQGSPVPPLNAVAQHDCVRSSKLIDYTKQRGNHMSSKQTGFASPISLYVNSANDSSENLTALETTKIFQGNRHRDDTGLTSRGGSRVNVHITEKDAERIDFFLKVPPRHHRQRNQNDLRELFQSPRSQSMRTLGVIESILSDKKIARANSSREVEMRRARTKVTFNL
jgi:hypothetical protein